MRNATESSEHINLVTAIVNAYRANGYTQVRADLPGEIQPATISGSIQNHIPDATAVTPSGQFVIAEAETLSTLGDSGCRSQFSLFADVARRCGGEFHVVVPKALAPAAEALVQSMQLPCTIVFHV